MSYIFDVGEETVWSPALRVGECYVSMLRCAGNTLDHPTGLIEISKDMYEIDIKIFDSLVRRMFEEYSSVSNAVYRRLMGGVLVVSMVLLERAGHTLDAGVAGDRELLDEVGSMSREMSF